MRVGVVGVTGAVGKEIIEVLATRKFPLGELKLPRSFVKRRLAKS